MARIKYYDAESGEWKYADKASSSDSSQKVNWNDIEDRPFYEDVKVLFEGEIDYSNSAYSEISPPIEFVEGVEYKVNVNGNVCSGIANFDSDQCEVVAYLYKEGEVDWCGILTSNSLSMFDIDALSSVKIYISTVKQLEEKYIEDSVQPKTGPFFCECTSSGSTANKTAKAQAFSIDALRAGMLVAVNFTAANTATSGVTLSIDGTEAKMIRDAGLNNGTTEITKGTHLLVFNGTYWIMLT